MNKYEKLQNKVIHAEQPEEVFDCYLVEVFNDYNNWEWAHVYRQEDVSEEEARIFSYMTFNALDPKEDKEDIAENWEEDTRINNITI